MAAAFATSAGPGVAQPIDCRSLQAQIAAMPRGGADPRAQAALSRQRAELQRTQAYAEQIGCNRRQFLFFGSPPPPECNAVERRLASMQANLGRLQAAVDRASGPRDALIARYNAYCTRQAAAPRGFFEQLFGGGFSEEVPIEAPMEPEETGPRRGSKAVCVRTCDGFFFPVSYSAHSQNPDRLADLCRAQCPAAETQVFTYSPARDITDAVSINGTPYMSLSNALRYRKTFDAACTCRPPGMSWAQTLEGAERLLQGNRRDLIVTPEKAEEMSRPRPQGPVSTPPRSVTRPGPEGRVAEGERRPGEPVSPPRPRAAPPL
jgi:hypothetical protein